MYSRKAFDCIGQRETKSLLAAENDERSLKM
jgi:hypothetical protein